MKNSKPIVSLVALALFVVGVCAQTINQRYTITDRQVNVILKRLERNTRRFRDSLNASLVNWQVDQLRPENDISAFVPGFEAATHHFKIQVGRHIATPSDLENVLREASPISGFMARYRLSKQVQNDWTLMRTDLNALANAYGLNWQSSKQISLPIYSNGSDQYSDTEVNQLIQRLEAGGDTFRTSLTEAFGLTPYDQTTSEGNMNQAVRDLKRETNQLRNQFDMRQPISSSVERLLARATPIDTYMRKNVLTDRVQNDWSNLRADLNTLAGAYNVAKVDHQ